MEPNQTPPADPANQPEPTPQPDEQKTVADVMKEMQDKYTAEIDQLNAKIKKMEVDHAKQLKDLMLGESQQNRAKTWNEKIAESAEKISKHFGGK